MGRWSIVVVIAALVIAVLASTVGAPAMQGMQAAFLSVMAPFLKTSTAVGEQLGAVGKGLKTLDQLEADNKRLETENKELRATNQILRDLETENNRLRSALDYRERSVFKLVPARVIGREASTWWNTIKINRGFEDGVDTDMPVLTDVGLVGKTTTVSKNEAIVLLVTDETCKVAAKIEGTPEQGIMTGQRIVDANGIGELQLNFLTKTAKLEPGQKVYTAGVTGGVFPSGVLLGEVKSFRARALDGQAIVTPAVDLATIEDVFVVVGIK
jgi:rod shape-determining protein MreC